MAMESLSQKRVISGVKQEKKPRFMHRITIWLEDYGDRKGREILNDIKKGYLPYI